MATPWLLALALVVGLLALLPARRLQLAGVAPVWIGTYTVAIWALGMILAIRPVASRALVPILVIAYLAPFVAASERVGRFLRRGGVGRGGGTGGPGAGGREIKDVTPPDERG